MNMEHQNGSGRVTNADLRDALNDATDSLRREFKAEISATSIQIGAVEATLRSKIEALNYRMLAVLLGGQVLATAIAAVIARVTPVDAAKTAFGWFHVLPL